MGGISVAHGDDWVPSPINKSSEPLQVETAETITSRVDTAPHGVEPQPYWLTADWLGLGHK